MSKTVLKTRFAQRLRDPLYNSAHGTERHLFYVAVPDVPQGISLGPSPRSTQTRWDVYKDVQASLLNKDCTPGTFHLKNQGITIVARAVSRTDDHEYEVSLDENHGVIDGAHTYRMILEAQKNQNIEIPKGQYIRVEVVTGIPDEWVAEISAGLNESMQSQVDRMQRLQEAAGWIKAALKDQKFFDAIAWTESERGVYDIADLLCMLTCFNTGLYPNAGPAHPIVAYSDKSVVLGSFETDHTQHGGKSYRRLAPIVKDVLQLHDLIQLEFPKLLAQLEKKAPGVLEEAVSAPFEFPFINARSTERLARGALFPILAAFRWMVEDDPASATVQWRGGFKSVVNRWRTAGERMVAQTIEKSADVGHNPDAIGKSATHWGALHKEIAFMDLMEKQAAAPAVPESVEDSDAADASEAPAAMEAAKTA